VCSSDLKRENARERERNEKQVNLTDNVTELDDNAKEENEISSRVYAISSDQTFDYR